MVTGIRPDSPLDTLTREELALTSNMLQYLLRSVSSDVGIAQALFVSATADKECVIHAVQYSLEEARRVLGEVFTELQDVKATAA